MGVIRELFIAHLFVLSLYSTSAITADQRKIIHENFEKIGMECIKDNPITGEDIQALREKKLPNGDHVPCFIACLLKNTGVMDEKGMLQRETALEMAKKVFNDDDELKMIGDYLHSCSHVNSAAVSDGEKGCERAMLSTKCMIENASQFGFDL